MFFKRCVFRIQNNPGFKVEHFFQFFERKIHHITDAAGKTLQKPDMGNRRGQSNMSHPLTANFGLNDFDTALFTHNPTVLHALITATKAFIIFHRPENFSAEKTIALRLECPVIDRLRLFDFAVGPGKNFFRRCDRNLHRIESDRIFWFFKITENVFHRFVSYYLKT